MLPVGHRRAPSRQGRGTGGEESSSGGLAGCRPAHGMESGQSVIPRGARLALCTALQRLPAAPGPRGRTQAPRHTPALGTRKTLSSHSGLARLHSVGTFLSVSVFKALNSCCVLAPLPFSPSLKTRYAERAWVLFLHPETEWGSGRGRGRHPGAAATRRFQRSLLRGVPPTRLQTRQPTRGFFRDAITRAPRKGLVCGSFS